MIGLLLLLQVVTEGGTTPAVPVPPGTRMVAGRAAVAAVRVEASPVIDGRLDEPAWKEAAVLTGFRQYRPSEGVAADEATEVRVWYSPTAIFFGITAQVGNPGSIRATLADRDKIDNDDRVLLFLDTFNDQRRAYVFGVNPYGIQTDGVRSEGGGGGGPGGGGGGGGGGSVNPMGFDRSQDFLFASKGRITESGYEVELRIPFKSLRFSGGEPGRWGINVVRVTQQGSLEDTWTDVRRGGSSFLAQEGLLDGLVDLHRGIATEVQPFLTATAVGARETDGSFGWSQLNREVGANFRLGLTSMSLDGTINPDFSQVESDAGQVTVNERFTLFLQERRPFFLEGIELFNTPGSLVYTRRIANPVFGAKFTGKVGRLAIAHLTSVDEQTGPDALVNVSRIRGDIGANSTAGVTYTDRTGGGAFNRVAAADARFVFGGVYVADGQLGGSWTRDSSTAKARFGPTWQVGFDRVARIWGFNNDVSARSDRFETQSGFVPRTDVVNARTSQRLSHYPRAGGLLEAVVLNASLNRLWTYQDFGHASPIEGDQNADLSLRLRGGWRINSNARVGFVAFDRSRYDGYEIDGPTGPILFVPLNRLTGAFGFHVNVNSPVWQFVNGNLTVQRRTVAIFAEASEGRESRLSSGVDLRPTSALRVNADFTLARIVRTRDGSEFSRSVIPRLKAEYQASRALFVRLISEIQVIRRSSLRDGNGGTLLVDGLRSEAAVTDRIRLDALVSFQPTPGTVAFFGYGTTLIRGEVPGYEEFSRTTDGLFVKLAYQIRR